MRVAGFVKVRNEIIREGNLYRLLSQLDQLCDCGVICDDASSDGTAEVLVDWVLRRGPGWLYLGIEASEQDWLREMDVKQQMLESLNRVVPHPDWILWMDGDELFDAVGLRDFRSWLARVHKDPIDAWSFHYTQPWRTMRWARTDSGFDDGNFWKLWRYRPDLAFETGRKDGLHNYQFPKTYLDEILDLVDHNRARRRQMAKKGPPRAGRAPFEIVHLGNVGTNLVLKAVSYRGTGRLAQASLNRHLYFGPEATYRLIPAEQVEALAAQHHLPDSPEKPMPFTDREKSLIERMERLRGAAGLVTVIVPTFNRGYILDRTLASLLAQTYDDWVCVVLDDGSTDNTPSVMRAWQDRDPRFFYCRYEENRGGVAMNEIGMNLATEFGEFWVRLGSDDYFERHKLELDIVTFGKHPECGVVFGPYLDLHESGLGRDMRNCGVDARGALLSGGFAAGWANIAVRTSVLKAVREQYGEFVDPKIRNMEDWLANTRLAYLAEFAWRGLTKSGDLYRVVGAGDYKVVHPNELVHDAVWRVGADGCSNKNAGLAALDARLTKEALDRDGAKFKPAPRAAWSASRNPYIVGVTK